ncbi:MAG TPA: O-acetyl-ADP-ribose deacetylase [Elusimicrobiota bacterium]|jgi:O-acetyl-ADP-ribose deacetylase|nr:O-acetyl-ADP-ribose deacetylase [Elusimicrobiota bacterium]
MSQEIKIGASALRLIQGDITAVAVDVIVNAANSSLAGGGGVDGAIHRAGGPAIMEELNRIRPAQGCPTGSAVMTGAGRLPAKRIIHAVGPRWRGGNSGEAELLACAYRTSLALAADISAASVSFPSISTGIYGYPVGEAASIALDAVGGFLRRPSSIREVVFVLFDAGTLAAYERALRRLG